MSNLNNLSIEQLKNRKVEIDKLIEEKERNVTPEQRKLLDSAAYKKDFKEIKTEMMDFLKGINLGNTTVEISNIRVYPNSFMGDLDIEGAVDEIIDCGDIQDVLEKAVRAACKTEEAKKYIQRVTEIRKKAKAFFKKYPGNEFYSTFDNLMEYIEIEMDW